MKERLICLVGFVPYRCRKCSLRFVAFRYALPEPAAPPVKGAEKGYRRGARLDAVETKGGARFWFMVRRWPYL